MPRDLAHRLDVIMLHRLLEPPIAELFERAADADRAAGRVAIVGVEGERETVADELAHRFRLGNVAGNIKIEPGAVVVEADLDRSRVVLEARFDDAQYLIDIARAVAADRGIERQARAPGAAEQFVDRLAEEFALHVPERDVERRERAGQRAIGPELGKAMERGVEKDGVIERVLTDQHRRDVARDDAERGEAALHRRRFADAVVSVIRVDADKGAALLRLVAGSPADLKRLDVADFHYASGPRPSPPHAGGTPAFQSVIGDFDEVVVGIADVDGLDRSDRAGARPGTGDDRHAAMPEMRDDLGERGLGDKAEIARARGRPIRDKARDVVGRGESDPLLAGAQRRAALAEGDDLHTEN